MTPRGTGARRGRPPAGARGPAARGEEGARGGAPRSARLACPARFPPVPTRWRTRSPTPSAPPSPAFPDLPDGFDPFAVEVEFQTPGNPEHGDLATNVALQLARPLGQLAPPDRGGHRRGGSRPTPSRVAAVEVAGPGLPQRPLCERPPRRRAGGDLGGRRRLGTHRRPRGRDGRRRVRLGQPDRPAHRRPRPERRPRRHARQPPRVDGLQTSRASTTSTTGAARCGCWPRASAPATRRSSGPRRRRRRWRTARSCPRASPRTATSATTWAEIAQRARRRARRRPPRRRHSTRSRRPRRRPRSRRSAPRSAGSGSGWTRTLTSARSTTPAPSGTRSSG